MQSLMAQKALIENVKIWSFAIYNPRPLKVNVIKLRIFLRKKQKGKKMVINVE
jgi:hypothetical protein